MAGTSTVFGKRMIGAEAADEARAQARTGSGGGAIQFGKRLGGVVRQAHVPPPVSTAPKAPAPVPEAPPKPLTAQEKRAKSIADKEAKRLAELQTPKPLTEVEVAEMLDADPTSYARILQAEAELPAIRPMVAALVLSIKDKVAQDAPIADEVVTMLTEIAQ